MCLAKMVSSGSLQAAIKGKLQELGAYIGKYVKDRIILDYCSWLGASEQASHTFPLFLPNQMTSCPTTSW